MQVEIGDRIVLHGRNVTRIGVVVEGIDGGGSRVRWVDGAESVLSAGTEAAKNAGGATWNAAKAGPAVTWRRGVTAGVAREASIAQEKLAAEEAAEHNPAAGE